MFERSHFWLWVIFHSLKDQQSPTRWVSSEHEGSNRTGCRCHRGHERPGAGQGQARPLFSISVPSSAPDSLSMPAKREGTCSSPLRGTPAAAVWGPAARLVLTRPVPPHRVLTAAWGAMTVHRRKSRLRGVRQLPCSQLGHSEAGTVTRVHTCMGPPVAYLGAPLSGPAGGE